MVWLGLDAIGFHPDPGESGWFIRPESREGGFFDVFGPMRIRREAETISRLQISPLPKHLNIIGSVYGGFLLAIVDLALFIGPAAQGRHGAIGGSTIDINTQFLAPLAADKVIDVLIETLRETKRMAFVRGTMEQEGVIGLAFSGTIRKAGRD